MIMSLKQRKRKFEPRIKVKHNKAAQDKGEKNSCTNTTKQKS